MQKVLLVDDESLILLSLSRALSNEGTEITRVSSGKDALQEIGSRSYDICFLDVQLPDANGLELMKDIRALSPATRIVIMTASQLTDEQHRTVTGLGGLFLPKPFDVDAAQAIVQSSWGRTSVTDL